MTRSALPLLLLLLLITVPSFAQDPTKWSLSIESKGDTLKAGEIFKAELKADVEAGWHLYALEQPEGGPIATTIKISDGRPFEIAGAIGSPAPTVEFDPNFQIETKFYTGSVSFAVPV
jgi:thiol:disulfide interchange protein DsbD